MVVVVSLLCVAALLMTALLCATVVSLAMMHLAEERAIAKGRSAAERDLAFEAKRVADAARLIKDPTSGLEDRVALLENARALGKR